MYDARKLQEGLDVAVETVVTQVQAARSPESLDKPDFWTLGYAGGCCLFFISRAGLETEDSLFYSSLVSAFREIFGAEKAPRMASYFLTFHNASGLVSEISDFDGNDEIETDDPGRGKRDSSDFLQCVRGIYRAEVFDKFISLCLSIRDVILNGKQQAELDLAGLLSKKSPTQPRGLTQYLLTNKES